MEGDHHGDSGRANESAPGTSAPGASEIHDQRQRGRSPRDCGTRLPWHRKERFTLELPQSSRINDHFVFVAADKDRKDMSLRDFG
jgi:hypothetical protein